MVGEDGELSEVVVDSEMSDEEEGEGKRDRKGDGW